MPCYTRVEIKMKFDVQNFEALMAALKAKGYEVRHAGTTLMFRENARTGWVTVRNGEATFTQGESSEAMVSKAKVAYAEHVVKTVGKRKGFRVQQAAGSNRISLKRSY